MPVIQCQRQIRLGLLGQLLIMGLSITGNLKAVESRFDGDAGGWTIAGDGGMAGNATECSSSSGLSAGHTFHSGELSASEDWCFRARAKFHGNFSSAYGAGGLTDDPVWRNNLGAAQPEITSARAVPEPPVWLLGILAAIVGLLFRWLV